MLRVGLGSGLGLFEGRMGRQGIEVCGSWNGWRRWGRRRRGSLVRGIERIGGRRLLGWLLLAIGRVLHWSVRGGVSAESRWFVLEGWIGRIRGLG